MIYPVPFKAEHFDMMTVQEAQKWVEQGATPELMRALEGPYSNTLMSDGSPLVCCGAIPLDQTNHRAYLWSILNASVNRHIFRQIHTYARRFLNALPFRRLEAAVDLDFDAGHRWVRSLGFKLEAPVLKAFREDGQDCSLYALVREDARWTR